MTLVALLNEYGELLNIVLIALVFPLLNNLRVTRKKEREHDEFIMASIAKSTKAIEQLRREMLVSQRRHERIEDAVLFLANDEKVKDVIAILRGFKKQEHAE